MKKLSLVLISLCFSWFSFADCSQLKQSSDSFYSTITSLRASYWFYGEYSSLTESFYKSDIELAEKRLQTLLDGSSFSGFGRSSSVEEQKTLIQADIDLKRQKLSAYQQYWIVYPQYISASDSYTKCLKEQITQLDPSGFIFNYNAALKWYNAWEYDIALLSYTMALNVAKNPSDIQSANEGIKNCKAKLSPSNDPLSYVQDYLKTLKIPAAWAKITNSKEVIVAIIDDGININHPDLVGKIWVKANAVYGASKIIDFVGDKIGDNMSTGQHGTMIAGIIGANTNNNEGIAGIAKNVKFMPLRVFGFDEVAKEENIIRALNYAIDNGANIINLSLGWSQFQYSDKYDSVIKRAYDKWIVVVIAAGNGDVQSLHENGVDLSINPISPVCNNKWSTEYSIGVLALDSLWYRTKWTNYNGCVLFSAPGEGIVSSSIPQFNEKYGTNYNIGDGTSFSAPMVTGIIALGYNQYGYVSPKIVIESLNQSLTKNSVWNMVIDASKYLDALASRLTTIQSEQKNDNARASNQKTIDANSDGNVLASFGIVKQQDSEEAYNLNSNVLRQEVIGMAMKLWKYNLPEGYTCKKIFKDVSSTKPNNWVCRAVEIGAENGVVSTLNKSFNPESSITRAEALAILMKAAGIKINEPGAPSKYGDVTVAWQINLVNTAFSYSFIDDTDRFRPNDNATRGEIFNMAKRILKSKN